MAALLAPLALQAAGPVHRCEAGGRVTYQSDPCPAAAVRRPTLAELNARQRQQAAAARALAARSGPAPAAAASPSAMARPSPAATVAAPTRFQCDGRRRCPQMTSCPEAKFFLAHCPGVEMDGDRDGVPCEEQWCR